MIDAENRGIEPLSLRKPRISSPVADHSAVFSILKFRRISFTSYEATYIIHHVKVLLIWIIGIAEILTLKDGLKVRYDNNFITIPNYYV